MGKRCISKITGVSLIILSLVLICCHKNPEKNFRTFNITLKNPTRIERIDEPVILRFDDLKKACPDFDEGTFTVVADRNKIPFQVVDNDGDGEDDAIIFVVDFNSMEKKTITIRFGEGYRTDNEYYPRVYAELAVKTDYIYRDSVYSGGFFRNVKAFRVPDNHTVHDALFKYEGPGWESELIGYRLYLDWRNSIDIFGKKVRNLVLSNVGRKDVNDRNDSYHSMQDWGMDIFKVGSSLGIGTPGIMINGKVEKFSKTDSVVCKILESGGIRARVRTYYFGWNYKAGECDVISDLSINAGSRLTKHEIQISEDLPNLCTGFPINKNCSYLHPDSCGKDEWDYIAQYGRQTVLGDNLGIAVIFRHSDKINIVSDKLNRIVILKPLRGRIEYFFLAAWEQEPYGIKSEEEFEKYLNKTIDKLNHPVIILYNP